MRALREGWKDAVQKEFRDRLGLQIDQPRPNGPVALVLPDGTRLDSLNRAGRRELDKYLSPTYTETTPSGVVVQKTLRLGAMDDRIYEIAFGNSGAGWNAEAFQSLFPEHARFVARYERRVDTLKAVGYLSADGKIAPSFRVHYALRQGIDTPELQSVRIDLAHRATHQARREPDRPAPDFWSVLGRVAAIQQRIERLGYSRDEFRRVMQEAARHKPTPERLRQLPVEAEKRAIAAPRPPLCQRE